jgi:hypothetical protein
MLASFSLGLAWAIGIAKEPDIENARLRVFGPYSSGVPTPESVLGYELGARHTVFMDQERVVQSLVSGTDRAKYLSYGKSTEGRPLRVVAISTPENIAKLDEIRANMAKIANAKPGDTLMGLEDIPTIVWINECIHGDETASFESGMALIYNLVASNDTKVVEALKHTVVMVNPSYNPDGHERYVVAYNSLPTGNGKDGTFDRGVPWPFMGRANHYRFDMNRDRIAMSQAETRQEVRFMQSWNPQVYVDQHGQVENYFMPPVQQSVNVNVDRDRYNHWTEIFGKATASAFDKEGWSYFIKDSFDLYAPCYLDSFSALTGAIGMTQETNGGRLLNVEERDGYVVTMREGLEKHFTSAMAVILSAAENRDRLMESFVDFKMSANSGKFAGKFQRVVLQGDRRDLQRFAAQLERMGVKSGFTESSLKQEKAHDYWSDESGKRTFTGPTLVIDMAQSMGPIAKAMLEPTSDFEPEFIERQKNLAEARKGESDFDEIDSYEFYDLTGWAMPYAYGLDAWWCEDTPALGMTMIGDPAFATDGSEVGYALPYRDRDDIKLVFDTLRAGYRVSMVTKKNLIQGQGLLPGTFLVMKSRNPDADFSRFMSGRDGWLPLPTSYPDEGRQGPGSESIVHLRRPEIGLVFGDTGELSGGSMWFLMEKEFKMPFRSLTTRGVTGALKDLSCLVVPAGVDLPMTDALKAWVRDGGALVLLGGGDWAMGEKGFFELEDMNADLEIPGSLYRAEFDTHSVLSYGYERDADGKVKIAVPISGTRFKKADDDTPLKLSADKDVKKLLTGWAWDDSDEQLAGVAWAKSVGVGRGTVTWFADDPSERAQWPGLWKMMLNAMILGAG